MYKIIGADGREYGPISAEVVQKWIAEGRANAATKVLPDGATTWVTIAEVPELAAALSGMAGAAPPVGAPAAFAAPTYVAPTSDALNGPAIGLIVTAALGFVGGLLGIVMNVFQAGLAGLSSNHSDMNPEMERVIGMFSGTVGIASNIIGLIASGLILYGALKMKKYESYAWAMTASILAIVPCVSPCCIIGLPIGIWALVMLSKAEVKAQFH